MSFSMPIIEQGSIKDIDWILYVLPLLDKDFQLLANRPIFYNKPENLTHEIICEELYMKLIQHFYRDTRFITPYHSFQDPFYNQLAKKKELVKVDTTKADTLFKKIISSKLKTNRPMIYTYRP
jgi:hypothetical protein